MATFFMLGKYSTEALSGANAERTERAVAVIKKHGGEVKSMYALLGEYDLAIIVELPGTAEAMKASMALTDLTGIAFSTSTAVPVEEFDKLVAED